MNSRLLLSININYLESGAFDEKIEKEKLHDYFVYYIDNELVCMLFFRTQCVYCFSDKFWSKTATVILGTGIS